ncbi:hypothetical protein J6590_043475 [Homalodisca vitripennis]|nr:hypothetical protein J6590_043475 [Homalodisca vitripennis]
MSDGGHRVAMCRGQDEDKQDHQSRVLVVQERGFLGTSIQSLNTELGGFRGLVILKLEIARIRVPRQRPTCTKNQFQKFTTTGARGG